MRRPVSVSMRAHDLGIARASESRITLASADGIGGRGLARLRQRRRDLARHARRVEEAGWIGVRCAPAEPATRATSASSCRRRAGPAIPSGRTRESRGP